MRKMTPKQEKFANLYLELQNASAAYRQAYDVSGMSASCVNVKASMNLKNDKIRDRISDLQRESALRNKITIDRLTSMLNKAYDLSLQKAIPPPRWRPLWASQSFTVI